MTRTERKEFAERILAMSQDIGFKISSRGWCYQLESTGLITKGEFDKAERNINECRERGMLPIDFVAEDGNRAFAGVEIPDGNYIEIQKIYVDYALSCENTVTPDWWLGEQYYIQMIVEKIDLRTLFSPVCEQYHIPIANGAGWQSMLLRASYARRFKEAESKGLKCVLLYCGDHDPAGLFISDSLRKNIADLQDITWADGFGGYDPQDLIIDRFGLNEDFIEANKVSWIDNLETGKGKDLSDPSHRDHKMLYVRDYIAKYGVRKCEANALVVIPEVAQQLARDAIEKYFGADAIDRFQQKKAVAMDEIIHYRQRSGLQEILEKAQTICGNETGQ